MGKSVAIQEMGGKSGETNLERSWDEQGIN
jgi:hypothetical protein